MLVHADGTPNEVGLASLGLLPHQVTWAWWSPEWDPRSIANGDFESPGSYDGSDTNYVPGWLHHGGGGGSQVDGSAANHYLELDWNDWSRTHKRRDPSRTHNQLYVPHSTCLSL